MALEIRGVLGFDNATGASAEGAWEWPYSQVKASATWTGHVAGLDGAGFAISGPADIRVGGGDYNSHTPQFQSGIFFCRFKPTAIGTERVIASFRGGPTSGDQVALGVNTAGALFIERSLMSGPPRVTSTENTLSSGTTYLLEVGARLSNSDTINGHVYVKLNGLLDDSLTLTDVAMTGSTSTVTYFTHIRLTNPNGVYDDCILQAGNGDVRPSDFLSDAEGNPKVRTLVASDDGFYSEFTNITGGGAHADEVDEALADHDTSMLGYGVVTDIRESFTYDALPGTAAQVLSVTSFTLARGEALGDPHLNMFVRQEGADIVDITDKAVAAGGTSHQAIWTRWNDNPATTEPWTVDEANALEAGCVMLLGGPGRHTQFGLIVVYSEAEAPPPPELKDGSSLLDHTVHFLVPLWKIERTDGVNLYFADASEDLPFDGETYVAMGGLSAGTRRREIDLRAPNLETRGVLTSDAITIADLRAGRYRHATITEYLVDARWPWLGIVGDPHVYKVRRTRLDGTQWVADVVGVAHQLGHKINDNYSRRCRTFLGSSRCKVPQAAIFTPDEVVASVIDDRRIFRFTTPAQYPLGVASDWFTDGFVRWTSGENLGLKGEIKDHAALGGSSEEVELQLPMPFDIAAGDHFEITAGCNKLFGGDCTTKYGNQLNCQCFPHMKSQDAIIKGASDATSSSDNEDGAKF